jgi:RNA polymerase sigma-70 factor (ECF subfamily)
MSGHLTTEIQHCLERLRAGDEAARAALLSAACTRLGQLTRAMLKGYRRLKRWEETDDVLQQALIRLHRALRDVVPASPRDFYRLAALQIRRELIDLARHYFGPEGCGANQATNAEPAGSEEAPAPAFEQVDADHGPCQLAAWGEFHAQVQHLPGPEQEVFGLVWYQGLTHAEAAEVLGVSAKTIQRRWQAACRKLYDALGGELPGL